MTGTPTTNWGFPTYDGTEPGSLKTIANAQANAAETAMNNATPSFFLRKDTLAHLNAVVSPATGAHATVYADGTAAYNGDYYYNGSAWKRIVPGLNLIIPTSATNATLNSDGSVSFTAQGSFTIDGVFTAGFDSYVIECDQTTASANTNLQFRERAGGVDASTAYFWDIIFSASASVAAANTPNDTQAQLTAQTALYRHTTIRVINPAVAAIRTMLIADDASTDTSTMGNSRATGWHGTAAAYDGFKILSTVGTITGKLRIYGISNR